MAKLNDLRAEQKKLVQIEIHEISFYLRVPISLLPDMLDIIVDDLQDYFYSASMSRTYGCEIKELHQLGPLVGATDKTRQMRWKVLNEIARQFDYLWENLADENL